MCVRTAIRVANREVASIRYALCVIQAGFHNGVEMIFIFRICENRICGQKLIQLGIWFLRARAQMIE